jgi:hypothetical protein
MRAIGPEAADRKHPFLEGSHQCRVCAIGSL